MKIFSVGDFDNYLTIVQRGQDKQRVKILLIPFAHSFKKLLERQLSGSSEIVS